MRMKKSGADTDGFTRSLTRSMHRRMVLFTIVFIFLLCVIIIVVVSMFGRVSQVETKTAENIKAQLLIFEHDVTSYFDQVAARGILLSKQLSDDIGTWLDDEGIAFGEIRGNREALESLDEYLFDTLNHYLMVTDCSGAYFILDATVNPEHPYAENSRYGLYLKAANINVVRPANPLVVLFRGSNGIGYRRGVEFHNQWALEFDTGNLPGYEAAMANAGSNLNACFLYTDAITLPRTWESAIMLMVPIIGADGEALGICGFEISQAYFKLRLVQSGTIPQITGLLTRYAADGPDADLGMTAGDKTGYYVNMQGTLGQKQGKYFDTFSSDNGVFIGIARDIRLSPLEQDRMIAVFMPLADYSAEKATETRQNITIIALIVLSVVLGSIATSYLYVRPIAAGTNQFKVSAGGDNSGIAEIGRMIEEIRELRIKNRAIPDDFYKDVTKRIKTLSLMENRVFHCCVDGINDKAIEKKLFITATVLRSHYSRIYNKLGVSNRQEFELYLDLIRMSGISIAKG